MNFQKNEIWSVAARKWAGRRMRFLPVLLLIGTVLPVYPAADENVRETLIRAAERQEGIRHSALSTVSGFSRLLEEIAANRLGADASPEVNRKVRDGLDETASERMAEVARFLRATSRIESAEVTGNVTQAKGEVEGIRKELLALLKAFGAREQRTAVRFRLQKMLDEQQGINERVQQFARSTIGKKREELSADERHHAKRLSSEQESLRGATADLHEYLNEVASLFPAGEPEADALRRVSQAMSRSSVHDDMDEAARSVDANRLGQAVMSGNEAEKELERLLALTQDERDQAAYEALNAAERELQELRKVAEEEKVLLGVTNAATPDDKDAFPRMETAQNELEHRTRQARDNLNNLPLGDILKQDLPQLDNVAGEMEKAADALDAMEKEPAVEHEKQAVENLERAIDALTQRLEEAKELAQQQLEQDTLASEWQQLQNQMEQIQQDQATLDQAIEDERDLIQDTRRQEQQQLPALAPTQEQIRQDVAEVAFAPENAPFDEMQNAEQHLGEPERHEALRHEEAALVQMQQQHAANAQMMQMLAQRMDALMHDMQQQAAMLQQNLQQMAAFMQQQQQLMNETQQAEHEGLPELHDPQQHLAEQVQPHAQHAAQHMHNAANHLQHQQQQQAMQQQAQAMNQMHRSMAQMQQQLHSLQNMIQPHLAMPDPTRRPDLPQERGRLDNPGKGNVLERLGKKLLPDGWDVNLPPKASEDILKALSGVFPEEYGEELEAYYRALAKEAAR